jgi:hypothetical protein
VDFSLFQDPNSAHKTARERMSAHVSDPVCAGCHKVTDPTGLALENFDGAGEFRTTENGVVIDASGDLDGLKFTGPAGLAEAIRSNPATSACVVRRVFSYSVGRAIGKSDHVLLAYFLGKFTDNDYRVDALFRTVATSQAFTAVAAQQPTTTTHTVELEQAASQPKLLGELR